MQDILWDLTLAFRIDLPMQSDVQQFELPAPERASDGHMRPSAQRQLDALSQDRMRQFLSRRIRFSAFALAITLTTLLLLKTVTGMWGTVWLVFASTFVTGIWAMTARLARLGQKTSERNLRQAEVLVFGCTFACLSVLTFANLEATSQSLEFDKYILTIRESLMMSLFLVIVYGLVIPNGSRRSLFVASTLGGMPTATIMLSLLTHATVFPLFPLGLRVELAADLVIPLAAAVCCATIGAGVGNRIRDRSMNIDELGPYSLKAPLGSGGMGDVYLAEHRLLKRLCAIKLIHPDKAGDSRVKAHFEREVKATATLTHPNTVQVYDYGTSYGGRFFYAMEFLDGMNLYQYVDQYGSMPPGRVIYILKQICGALQEAWYEGLVHRDIKPSNIFLSERGHVYDVAKLLDFGLVQAALGEDVGMRRQNTQIQGSPAFMCPEQASGLEPDCRGDLYSLGAVAWYLLTGHPPFRDENPIMLIVAHATEAVPSFAEAGVSVPDDLAGIIMKCLSKKPEERFGNPREMLLALEACESDAEWDWKSAESWWLQNAPSQNDAVRSTIMANCKTMSLETAKQKAASLLDKTQIYERDELAAAGAVNVAPA